MERCDICGKECKTAQGLAGHRQWAHGIAPSSPQLKLESAARLATEQQLSMLDDRMELAETQGKWLAEELAGTDKQLVKHTEQLKELQEQLKEMQKQLKDARSFDERLTELRKLIGEAVSVIGEDLYLLLLGIGGHKHDPQTGAVTFTVEPPLANRLKIALEQANAWEFTAAVAEMFKSATGIAVLEERFKSAGHRRGKG